MLENLTWNSCHEWWYKLISDLVSLYPNYKVTECQSSPGSSASKGNW